MGLTIILFVEKKVKGKWEYVPELKYYESNSLVAACLAADTEKSYHYRQKFYVKPISTYKGIPVDLSEGVKEYCEKKNWGKIPVTKEDQKKIKEIEKKTELPKFINFFGNKFFYKYLRPIWRLSIRTRLGMKQHYNYKYSNPYCTGCLVSSWLFLKELLSYDWENVELIYDVYTTPEEYGTFEKEGQRPKNYSTLKNEKLTKKVKWKEIVNLKYEYADSFYINKAGRRIVDEKYNKKTKDKIKQKTQWFLFLEKLKKISKSKNFDDVRVVFWFSY